MKEKTAVFIIGYGVFLGVIGLLGFLSNPEQAKTALISGGTFGALSILWGGLTWGRVSWAPTAALVTTAFLLAVFTWRASVGWMDFFGGDGDKLIAASLISMMWVGSAFLIGFLISTRRSKHAQ